MSAVVPQAAIDAATIALRNEGTPGQLEALAAIVLEAAAPFIAAAERERIRQLAIGFDARYYVDPEYAQPFADLLTGEDAP